MPCPLQAATLSAAMPNQLAFALEPPKYAGPQGIAAFGRFARSIEALKPLVLQDLAGPMLAVQVSSSTGPVLGKAFVQQDAVLLPANNRSWCAVLVVINGQNHPAQFQAELGGLHPPRTALNDGHGGTQSVATVPDYVRTAFTMLPFNSYGVELSNATVAGGARLLKDIVSATQMCDQLPHVPYCKSCLAIMPATRVAACSTCGAAASQWSRHVSALSGTTQQPAWLPRGSQATSVIQILVGLRARRGGILGSNAALASCGEWSECKQYLGS